LLDVRCAPMAIKFCSAAKCREVPDLDIPDLDIHVYFA
jgi:hypothetical protein